MNSTRLNFTSYAELYLSEEKMAAVYAILAMQMTGTISNIACVVIVYLIKSTKYTNRPKILMANIAVSDTFLTINSIVPRLIILKYIYHEHRLTAHIVQSFRQYLDNMTLYATSFTFTLVACDRYYAITRVFENPFDKYSTKIMLITIWALSSVLSLPFLITSDVDFYDFTTSTLYCINDGTYLTKLASNEAWIYSTRLIALFIEFIFPTLMVTWFSGQIIYKLFEEYRNSLRGIQVNTDLKKCEITKRLITVLLIFIVKNTSYYLSIIGFNFDFTKKQSNSCDLSTAYYFFYVIFRTTSSFNSIIFFWFSTEFRYQLTDYMEKRRTRSRTLSSSVSTRSSIFTLRS